MGQTSRIPVFPFQARTQKSVDRFKSHLPIACEIIGLPNPGGTSSSKLLSSAAGRRLILKKRCAHPATPRMLHPHESAIDASAVKAPTIRSSQIMWRRHRNGANPFHLLELMGVDRGFPTSAGFCRRGAGSGRGFCLTKSQ